MSGKKLFKSKKAAMKYRNMKQRKMGRGSTKIGGKNVTYPKGSTYLQKGKKGYTVYWYRGG